MYAINYHKHQKKEKKQNKTKRKPKTMIFHQPRTRFTASTININGTEIGPIENFKHRRDTKSIFELLLPIIAHSIKSINENTKKVYIFGKDMTQRF